MTLFRLAFWQKSRGLTLQLKHGANNWRPLSNYTLVTCNLSRNVQFTHLCSWLNAALKHTCPRTGSHPVLSGVSGPDCGLAWFKAYVAPVWDLIAPARWKLAASRDKHTIYETHFRNYKQWSCVIPILTTASSSGKDQVAFFVTVIYRI